MGQFWLGLVRSGSAQVLGFAIAMAISGRPCGALVRQLAKASWLRAATGPGSRSLRSRSEKRVDSAFGLVYPFSWGWRQVSASLRGRNESFHFLWNLRSRETLGALMECTKGLLRGKREVFRPSAARCARLVASGRQKVHFWQKWTFCNFGRGVRSKMCLFWPILSKLGILVKMDHFGKNGHFWNFGQKWSKSVIIGTFWRFWPFFKNGHLGILAKLVKKANLAKNGSK